MESVVQFFHALADTNRIRIINLLLESDELCVCDIEQVLQIPQARVSRHLNILRHAGLVNSRRKDQWKYYSLRSSNEFLLKLKPLLKDSFGGVSECCGDLLNLAKKCCVGCAANTKDQTE